MLGVGEDTLNAWMSGLIGGVPGGVLAAFIALIVLRRTNANQRKEGEKARALQQSLHEVALKEQRERDTIALREQRKRDTEALKEQRERDAAALKDQRERDAQVLSEQREALALQLEHQRGLAVEERTRSAIAGVIAAIDQLVALPPTGEGDGKDIWAVRAQMQASAARWQLEDPDPRLTEELTLWPYLIAQAAFQHHLTKDPSKRAKLTEGVFTFRTFCLRWFISEDRGGLLSWTKQERERYGDIQSL